MSLAMSKSQREAFLADVHVGVISVADPGHGPLALPIWYRYEPGTDVRMVTGRRSKKAELIRKAGRISLCVQSETAPYKYVSVEGPVAFGEPDLEHDIRQMAYRYLGKQMGDMYLHMTADERAAEDPVLIRLTPMRWITVDYQKMGEETDGE